MSNQAIDAVVAGTRTFAVTLLAPLTARIGVRPRIAADAGQALALCRGPGGLVVIEYLGDASLVGIEQLVREGHHVVAGVPQTYVAAEAPLKALGIEIARWDGRPEAVLAAVERKLAAPAAKPVASVASRPTPTIAPASPAPARAAVPRPAVPAAPRPAAPAAVRAAAPAAPRPGASAAPPAPVVSARPAPAAPLPATPGAPSAPPPAGAPSTPTPAAVPAVAPAPAPAAVAIVPPPPPEPIAPPPPEGTSPSLFDDPLEQARDPFAPDDPIDVDVDDAIAAIEASPPVLYAPPPPSAAAAVADWPATAPGFSEAEGALVRALSGSADAAGFGAVAAQVAAGLSDLERDILLGGAPPIDAEPIRRAAVTRARVAAALASAPAAGSRVDAGAVHGLLGEIDALLSAVGALAAGAPPELQGSLEVVRNALVKEAIDFSEVAQRVESAAPPPARAEPRPARRPPPTAGLTKVIDVRARAEAPRGRMLWVLAALVVLGAGGFHLHRYLSRPAPLEIPTLPGAPDGLMLTAHGGKQLLVSLPGKKIDPKQLEDFRAKQLLGGIEVREIARGTWILVPVAPPSPGEEAR